jgi:hypothetical protein
MFKVGVTVIPARRLSGARASRLNPMMSSLFADPLFQQPTGRHLPAGACSSILHSSRRDYRRSRQANQIGTPSADQFSLTDLEYGAARLIEGAAMIELGVEAAQLDL